MTIYKPILTVALFRFFTELLPGQVAVTDPAQLAQRERHHVQDTLQRSQMLARQMEEIRHLSKQVAQMETQLNRMGDPATTTALKGSQALERSLASETTFIAPDKVAQLTHRDISDHIVIDGESHGPRDEAAYRLQRAFQDALHRYQRTRDDVFTRRRELRAAMLETTRSLKAATSDSEVQKLQGVLLGFQTELLTLAHELDAANQEVLLCFFNNQNHQQLEAKASQEDEAISLREGARHLMNRFSKKPLSQ